MTKRKENPQKAGRPSEYTQEIADKICALLAEGISLRTVCKGEEMPDLSTIFRWMRVHPEFNNQYAKAKEESADAMLEETMDIADNGSNDWMATNDPENPGFKFNGESFQRSRLRVDTRKWAMSKLKPKKYGDKIDMTTNGKDLPSPIYGGSSTKNI